MQSTNKYLKYKNKYLHLKFGGSNESLESTVVPSKQMNEITGSTGETLRNLLVSYNNNLDKIGKPKTSKYR
jgi:hypothetical protein